MSWAAPWVLWLAVPVGVTLLAALWSWVRSRPRRAPDTAESMRSHTAYLDALGASTRTRRPSAPPPAPPPVTPSAPGPSHRGAEGG
jgi:hypothetical protein